MTFHKVSRSRVKYTLIKVHCGDIHAHSSYFIYVWSWVIATKLLSWLTKVCSVFTRLYVKAGVIQTGFSFSRPKLTPLVLVKLWGWWGGRTQLSVVDKIMVPKHSQVLSPQTYEYVSVHGPKDLTHMVKLVILQWDLCKREAGVMGQRGTVTREGKWFFSEICNSCSH